MKKIIITGGSGFIGSHFVDFFILNNYEVTILDLEKPKYGLFCEANFIQGDVTDKRVIARAFEGKDLALHLAGLLGTHELVKRAIDAVRVNIGGTISVLDACSQSKVKLVFISKPNYWLNPLHNY